VSVKTPPQAEAGEQADGTCTQCGAPLSDGQEWCLECGGAHTPIHRPPDWRIPIAVIGLVVAVALTAFIVALIDISSDANQRSALAAATVTTPAPAPPATTAATATTPSTATTPTTSSTATTGTTGTTATTGTTGTTGTTATTATTATTGTTATTAAGARLESWPPGLSGWTVVLASARDQATADATARQIAATGIQVGVLDSSQHPKLTPGYWLVFSGRYPTIVQAQIVAQSLLADGQQHPQARLVAFNSTTS
jgi:septal ring-binding cell division protein DamX